MAKPDLSGTIIHKNPCERYVRWRKVCKDLPGCSCLICGQVCQYCDKLHRKAVPKVVEKESADAKGKGQGTWWIIHILSELTCFTELPTIFIPHQLEASTAAIKPCSQKAEPQFKVISEPEIIKDNDNDDGKDEEIPHKRLQTTCMNCRSSGSFIVSNEMKQTILVLEGKMLTACGYLKELQGHASTIEMFITSQQADLKDLKVVMGIWGNVKEATSPLVIVVNSPICVVLVVKSMCVCIHFHEWSLRKERKYKTCVKWKAK